MQQALQEPQFEAFDLGITWKVFGNLRESDLDAIIAEKSLDATSRANLVSLWAEHPKRQQGAVSTAVPTLSPIEKFRELLPVTYGLTEELENMIKFTYSSKLLTISTSADAINLFEVANNHPRMSTRVLLEAEHDLSVDGDFDFNLSSARATLVRAFSKTSGKPFLLKFGTDINAEFNNFCALGLTEEQSLEKFIVPMVLIRTLDHRSGLRLPVMYCSLDVIPCLKEELVLKRMAENIIPALTHLHDRGLFHMDVKPGNILIGPNDCWFLCDLGSAVAGEGRVVGAGLTPAYIPRDLRRISNKKFDFTLLTICAILKVLPQEFTRFNDLTMKDVERIVRSKFMSALKTFCLGLLGHNA